jgi:hypothetical protein
MLRRRVWFKTFLAASVVVLLAGGFDSARASDSDVPDVDPAGVTDPVERNFYHELRELREKQKRQRQELSGQDLTPEERLDRRREMLLADHREIQQLDSAYQSRLSPEARSRWMERKANRQKRFDKLQRGTETGGTQKPLDATKTKKKNQK